MMDIKNDIISEFEHLEIIDKIYLFGSRIENPNKEKSDIDLCFVIDDKSDSERIIEIVARILTEKNIIIHPVIFKKMDFENKMKIEVYRESIIKKGKILYSRKENKA